MKLEHFPEFFEAFLEAALWTTQDDDDAQLDEKFTANDFDAESKADLLAHARSFFVRTHFYIEAEPVKDNRWQQAGHDFWLTSQGHGAGFWDGDWPVYGELLTNVSKCYPTIDITVGDDGNLYV